MMNTAPPRMSLAPGIPDFTATTALYEAQCRQIAERQLLDAAALEHEAIRLRHQARILAPCDLSKTYAPPVAPEPAIQRPLRFAAEMKSEAIVEKQRRFQGRVFRVWVEDCMVRGGIRVHAMDTLSCAQTHVDLCDATVQHMFDGYWEKMRQIRMAYGLSGAPTTDAEHNAELREFLGCLLDSVYFEMYDGSDSLTLQVPNNIELRHDVESEVSNEDFARSLDSVLVQHEHLRSAERRHAPLTKTWICDNILMPRPSSRPTSARPRSSTRSGQSRVATGRAHIEAQIPVVHASPSVPPTRRTARTPQRPPGVKTSGSAARPRVIRAEPVEPNVPEEVVEQRVEATGGGNAQSVAPGDHGARGVSSRGAGGQGGMKASAKLENTDIQCVRHANVKPAPPSVTPGEVRFVRRQRPTSARGERREERYVVAGPPCQARPPAEPWHEQSGWVRNPDGSEARVIVSRQRRPVSAKALKHKRVPDCADGPTIIYEDREPSVTGDSDNELSPRHTTSIIEHTFCECDHPAFAAAATRSSRPLVEEGVSNTKAGHPCGDRYTTYCQPVIDCGEHVRSQYHVIRRPEGSASKAGHHRGQRGQITAERQRDHEHRQRVQDVGGEVFEYEVANGQWCSRGRNMCASTVVVEQKISPAAQMHPTPVSSAPMHPSLSSGGGKLAWEEPHVSTPPRRYRHVVNEEEQ